MGIIGQLAAAEPDRADYQRDLSVAYERIGDLRHALGHGDAARQAYERSLAILEQLAAAEPDRADYQRDLSVCHDNLARLWEEAGDRGRALDYRERDLAIAESLLGAEPDRADLAHDLAISLLETARLDPSRGSELRRRVIDLLEPWPAEERLTGRGLWLLEQGPLVYVTALL